MSLVTRCPNCGTAFRVQSAQLSARGGKVRCGKCAVVFDGVGALVEEGAAPEAALERSPQLALFDSTPQEPAAPFLKEEPPPPRRRLAWGLAAAAAFAALLAQALLYFRTEVAVLFPEARPHLVAACAALGCEVRLPRRPELMSIESSDLQSDHRREGVIVLNAVLRNRAPFAQEFPALELTLTDERDQMVLRRVLAPSDYLRGQAAQRLAQGVAAGAEAALRVHLDTSGVRAAGYRLYLFFPDS
jgi:predicted Zn finger-like uncharacterized protein